MELRMIGRRSLNGSMTVVGDIAQATGAWANDGWDNVLAQLPRSTMSTVGSFRSVTASRSGDVARQSGAALRSAGIAAASARS